MFEIKEIGEDEKIKIVRAGKILTNSMSLWIIGVIFLGTLLGGALIDWLGFCYLGLATILAVLALNTIIIIPTVYFGIPTMFKKRIKKDNKVVILEEGINFRLPLVDDLLPDNTKSQKVDTQGVKAGALSKDKLEVALDGSVQYSPSNLNTYIERTQKTIDEGMVDAIESELGKICGIKDADIFIEGRAEIELLIQCVLQLEKPPHHYIDEGDKIEKVKAEAKKIKKSAGFDENEIKEVDKLNSTANKVMGVVVKKETLKRVEQEFSQEKIKELVEKLSPEKWKLEKEDSTDKSGEHEIDIVRFYKDNISRISLLFEISKESKVERLYGVEVAAFRIAELSFSETAQKAFEEQRAAKAKMAAAEERLKKKKKILKQFLKLEISPDQAVNLTETTAGVEGITRQIVSVEGSKQADLLAFGNLLTKR